MSLFRVPDGTKISTNDEIAPRDNRLILAEGEITGHHHAITIDRPIDLTASNEMLGKIVSDNRARRSASPATARLYRDVVAVRALISAGELTTDRLAIGFLIVEGQPVVLRHDEHDAIRIPPGFYYVGGQAEYDLAEMRRVQD